MNYYETDTEFMERLEQFAFHEVVNEEGQQLDAPTRWLAVLAALVGCQGIDAYREFLPKDCLSAKVGGAVNGGAYAPFILTVDWLGWLCYLNLQQ